MKKVVHKIFNYEKYEEDRRNKILHILKEKFGVNNTTDEEYERCYSISPYSTKSEFEENIRKTIYSELKINEEDYEESNEYVYLNTCLDKTNNLRVVVCDKEGKNIQSFLASECEILFE